ncbi:hypothetical protein [Usitatibacter palustris]|uniref:Uncharacterized protein n=1 Tax=Usitatibacter palustris TaxID=2732487 RepID=A0A6M4H557_9PROT|nr:hypothetical protein [Usitatibacter palustris]QJR14412.1 hypothetical protein DSM104440_01208 [Usitatibacter palustris]
MKWLALAACAFGLGACALLEEEKPAPVVVAPAPPRKPTSADELLAYLDRLRALDEAALALETSRQREFAKKDPTDLARLKAALALSTSPQSEEADILALIEPLLREGYAIQDADALAMASFLQGMALERRRLKESAAVANGRSRDDRKAMDAQKHRADHLEQRVTQLQQKIDALTSLEKSLSKRATQGK